ncbi:hypothetical protein MuYL_1323 [Mucilaginibacter xinganensis]|uniref:DUF4177 domain-containing protein n=2 Tax=Mucilaginibacter xinganensis TaxID=1234841 RepID=A0A223NUM7_9SPHI|nr:hypothetical protein MuYL_1323 [Mucilaginibacter xinganensis]
MFFTSGYFAFAQNKVDKYCRVSVSKKAKISFGLKKELFAPKDTTVIQKLNYVNQLTTETDVLNYMTGLGWKLVDIHAGGLYTATEVIYFKKEFDISELDQQVSK